MGTTRSLWGKKALTFSLNSMILSMPPSVFLLTGFDCTCHCVQLDTDHSTCTVCGPWSATFPKTIKYPVEKKHTEKNERSRDLLVSTISYDEVSAFLLWVKARN